MINIESSIYVKSKKLILQYLENNNSATTQELIIWVSDHAEECRDKVPHALLSLAKEKKVSKILSKEKKGFVWTLIAK